MRGPDGNNCPMKGEFLEVVPPERLVFSNVATDNQDKHLLEGKTTVTFTEKDGKTTLIARHRSRSHRIANARRHGSGLDPEHRQAGRTVERHILREVKATAR